MLILADLAAHPKKTQSPDRCHSAKLPGTLCTALLAATLLWTGAGAARAQVQTLYSFGGPGTPGTQPAAGLVTDGKCNLYGTTTCQQSSICDDSGIAFELSPISGGGWKETLLHAFGDGTTTDGSYTTGSLILDAKGNVYGTTLSGVANNGAGTVIELSPGTDGTWAEKILYSFGGADNAYGPTAALVFDAKGNLSLPRPMGRRPSRP